MRCKNCNSSKKVTLRDKHFCADCGHRLNPPETTATPPVSETSTLNLEAKPENNLLDLTQQKPKSAAASRPKPSHTIHGVRRNQSSAQTANAAATVTKPQVNTSRHQRIQRAQQVGRSPRVSKFAPRAAQPAASAPEPDQAAVTLTPHETYQVNQKKSRADQAAAIAMHHQRTAQPPQIPAVPTAEEEQPPSLLDKIARLFKPSPRLAMSTATALSVLILAGYISYLNYPNLALRVAANRAGIDASLPNYTPSGYSFSGPIEYSSGQVAIRFNSNSDAGFINLGQSNTNWDSASLLENYVRPKSQSYREFQHNGLTIYLYGGSNAAWVNGGVLYTIEGNNFLNSEQIIKMAASL